MNRRVQQMETFLDTWDQHSDHLRKETDDDRKINNNNKNSIIPDAKDWHWDQIAKDNHEATDCSGGPRLV